ncbi:ABC transporter permease subunit [Bacillus sp. HMF5848]|uniref:ABC transporter permease n=1 Tax=Bacillus sp. HMF5848 TaxID=2495421 RepID=UPI000F77ACB8|nr:ABC transporter permease subunit [Bacillus sp. HMF5848]RSK29067.1 ABC transporter permease subunit [Bacillus sp. HMF5848]
MKSFKNKRLQPYVYVLPSFLFLAILVGYGLWMAGVESVSSEGTYQNLLSNKDFIDSVGISIWVAFVSTILSICIGILITRTMFRLFKRDTWKILAWFPMLIPHFVAAYIAFIILAPSGWLSSLLYQLGFIDSIKDFPILINDAHYIGVIFSYVWKEVPFVVLMLLPAYQELDLRFEDVVRTLGGGTWKVWQTVELPWMWPVLLEIALILMAFIMGAYEVPALLGVTYPKMLPILAYQWFYEGNWVHRPDAQALMVLLSIVTIASTALILSISRKWQRKWMVRER